MRIRIAAANWKLNQSYSEGINLANSITNLLGNFSDESTKIILATPFIHLHGIAEIFKRAFGLHVAAQNCSLYTSGAFTGEVSAEMIRSTGAEYVILGHSERRNIFGETDEMIAQKIKLALAAGLNPIFCCGEKLEERNQSHHFQVVRNQLMIALKDLTPQQVSEIVIAYEPVWAIGTGLTATPDEAQEMHKFIRSEIATFAGASQAESISILYGGSCNAKNASTLFAMPDVDGGLIGGASLIAEDFIKIVHSL